MAMVAMLGWLHCLLAAAAVRGGGGGGAHTGNHGNNGQESDCRTNDSVSNGDDMGDNTVSVVTVSHPLLHWQTLIMLITLAV